MLFLVLPDEFIRKVMSRDTSKRFKTANEILYRNFISIPIKNVRTLNPQKVHMNAITGNAKIPA